MENNENKEIKVSPQTESLYGQITRQTIENIKSGNAPWQKDQRQGDMRPYAYNPASGNGGHAYAAFNRILLAQAGFSDPRFMTFEQAQRLDLLVKNGSTHQKAVNFKTHDYVPVYDARTGEVARDDKNRQIKRKVQLPEARLEIFRLFNVSQLQTKNYEDVAPFEFNPDVAGNYAWLDSIFNWADLAFNPDAPQNANDINFTGPWLREDETDPDKAHCDSLRNLVSLVHAEFAETNFPAGSMDAARVELTEQIATWLLAEELGIYHVTKEGDYRRQWLDYLEDKDRANPFKLAVCAQEADKIKDHVLDLENMKDAKQRGEKYYRPDPVDMAKMRLWQNTNRDMTINVEMDGKVHASQGIILDDSAKYLPNKVNLGVYKDASDKWFLAAGNDIRPVSQYLPLKPLGFERKIQTPEQEFKNLLLKNGFELSGDIQIDGEYHKSPVKDGKNNDGVYRVTIREDKVPQLFFANNVTGQKGFSQYTGGQLTAQEINALKAKAAQIAEVDKTNALVNQEIALEAAKERYNVAGLAPENHKFYVENDITDMFFRMDEKGDLLVPRVALVNNPDATHIDYRVQTFQHVNGNGPGYSEKGCKKAGTMFILDTPEMDFAEKTAHTIVIAESLQSGITLGSTVRAPAATPVVVAFEAHNIKAAAESVRAYYPEAQLLICPDYSKDLLKNENIRRAEEVGAAIKANVVVPPLTAEEKANGLRTFNDVGSIIGIPALKDRLGMSVYNAAKVEKNGSRQNGGFER